MTTRTEKIAKMHADVASLRSQISDLQNPNVGEAVDEAVQIYMRENPGTSYSDALAIILRANPQLAKEFEEGFTFHVAT